MKSQSFDMAIWPQPPSPDGLLAWVLRLIPASTSCLDALMAPGRRHPGPNSWKLGSAVRQNPGWESWDDTETESRLHKLKQSVLQKNLLGYLANTIKNEMMTSALNPSQPFYQSLSE